MSVKAPQQRANWHDAFDAQMALWRWYRSPMGRLYMEDSLKSVITGLQHESTRGLLIHMYGSEATRLFDTDPIYVSSGMCDVIEAAAPEFKPEPLLETDLMTPRGFIFFARPFDVPDRYDKPTTIRGCSWVRLFNSANKETVDRAREAMENWHGGVIADLEEQMLKEHDIEPFGVSLTIYCDTNIENDYFEKNEHAARIRELYPGNIPQLVPLHLTPWYFNMAFDGNEVDENGIPSGAEWWWRVVQTTLRLMQQRISSKSLNRLGGPARRDAKKIGARPDTEVVVVRLRRERGEKGEPTGESANYSHRFIVGGHWRNQFYRSEDIHRQIWISPYVKGPKDKPLIVRPRRVYQWDR